MTMKIVGTALAAVMAAATVTAAGSAKPAERWGGAWGYATSPATRAVRGTQPAGTFRFRFRVSQSGDGVRLTFTNPEGAVPLQIAGATLARAGQAFAIDPASERHIGFGGSRTVTIAPGATLTTDAIDWHVRGGDDLTVTVVTAADSSTVGGNAGFPAAFAPGATDAAGTGLTPQKIRPLVTQIAVRNPASTCTIVTFGDSITEGARGTRPDWRGWPGTLSRRLVELGDAPHCGVVNMGISGNRLLRDGRGTAGIARFDRDVASVPGVRYLILLEGINDIWHSAQPGEAPVTPDDLIAGYRTIIAAAHARGIKVIGATLTPGQGSKYLTPDLERTRAAVNRWIRSGQGFDAVIDFEKAIRDDGIPPAIKPPYDSGDHMHPGDDGYEAIGRAIPLSLFRATP
jgi:lysophospholipase L1-like esterase